MNRLTSACVVAVLACVLWGAGLTFGDRSTVAAPADARVTHRVAAPAPETDQDRRLRLNARMQEMIQSGSHARLADPRPPARARPMIAARPAPKMASEGRPARRASSGSDVSTIAPPPVRPGAFTARSGGYRPPTLDLITAPTVPTDDVECLTQAIYYEARTESEEGQAAVAEVVLNRSRSGAYPKEVCAVVYQRNARTCQFTFTCDGSIGRGAVNMAAWARAERIARDVYAGQSQALLPASSVNYHANYVRPSWGRRLERVRQIGAHIFYGAALSGQTPGARPAGPAEPAATRGLQFVRIEALDRAYNLMTSGSGDQGGS